MTSAQTFGELRGAEQLEVLLVLNLCEELGGVYMHGMVEKDVVRRSLVTPRNCSGSSADGW